ncbi:unnamed protein product [Oikopleura dioica]|uniref:NERD domain-containing protein n=1 Tax=Oikopleura dioica TaxID=34765 RepID=E4Y573_OIKDI|nr:unnamed protein product [Oikopleura dioica]
MLGGYRARLAAQDVVANPTKHEELPEVEAQRKAEDDFVNDLVNLGKVQKSQIRRRLRVSDTFGKGQRELQIVLTTDFSVFVFLVKPWSGKYKPGADAKDWLSISETDEATSIKLIKSPLLEIEQQCKLLHSHLISTGAAVKSSAVEGFLIFSSSSIDLPEDVLELEHVLTGSKIKSFCRKLEKSWTQYLTDPLKPSFFTGALSYKQLSAANIGLSKGGSYDKIKLTGGRLIEGDFKACPMTSFDRSEIGRLEFIHNRTTWFGSAKALLGAQPTVTIRLYKRGQTPGWISSGSFSTNEIPFNVSAEFHAAGESAIAKIPVNEIEFINLA